MKDMSQNRKKVAVDQRKLVTNILSHYSGPFELFRELIQNADDANAAKVEIYFFTENNDQLKDTGANVTKWLIRDNGCGLVGDDEWARLRTIARGNEEPDKVGTFGVGFYIVLGVCDRPLMRSHGRFLEMTMSHGDEPEPLSWEEGTCCPDGWTTIELVLKDGLTKRLPDLISLARFLISSIVFLEKVNTITVFLCDREVLCIKNPKNVDPGSEPLAHIRDIIGSPGRMTIKSANFTAQHVSVDATGKEFLGKLKEPVTKTSRLRAFPPSAGTANQTTSSPPSEPTMKTFSAEYCLYTAQIEAPREMQQEVKSRVKDVPCSFSCHAIYFSAEQRSAVEQCLMKDLFYGEYGILPSDNSGRVFIGQSTKELTNIGLHIATKHLITDVVRGSIRLGYDSTGKWNESLLNAAGHLARAVYEQEMKKSERAVKVKELALYTMQQFSCYQDPRLCSEISRYLRTGFFSEPKPSVFSNLGICNVSSVRQYEKRLHSVLKNIPHLDTGLSPQEQELIESKWDVQRIGFGDILAEFTSRPGRLSEAAIAEIFSWWQDEPQDDDPSGDEEFKKKFITDLRLQGQLYCEECGVIELKKIKQYTHLTHNKKLLPPHTIYIDETPNCAGYLKHFGWKLLEPNDWLEYVLAGVGPENAIDGRVLTALAGPYGISNKSSDMWKQTASRLASFRCIDTSSGLQKPCDSYLRIANIFNDVPVAKVASPLSEEVYMSLGVRSRLNWDELLERLEASPTTVYTNDRFLPYLADMMAKEGLSDSQISNLKTRNVFDSESHGKFAMMALHTLDKLGDTLHDPDVPILALRGVDGISVDLLKRLGVRAYPSLQVIDKWLATSDNLKLANRCLKENDVGYREEVKKSEVVLIPTENGELARLNEVCCHPSWKELGFKIISTSLAGYAVDLGVEENPLPDTLIHHLKNETVSEEMVQKWFERLSQVVPDFKGTQLDELGQIPFIPFARRHLLSGTRTCLQNCFIKASLPTDKPYLENILPFIGFGDDKDHLLARATNRNPPKTSDIARVMADHPQEFLKLAGTDNYEKELRDIAKEFESFNDKLRNDMRASPMLLRQCRTQDGPGEERLKLGGEILIGGDTDNLFDFGHAVFIAPHGLETLYEKLGSKRLDGCVVYHAYPGNTDPDTTSPIKPEDIKECVKAFKHAEQSQEWQLDISNCVFQVKTCQGLELEKLLCLSSDIHPADQGLTCRRRDVGAGFGNDVHGSMILWTVRNHVNLYIDTATALCRKLLKTYSRKDVLAMELLLRFEDRRIVPAEDASVLNDKKTVTKTNVQRGIPGQEEDRSSINPPSAISQTPVSSPTRKRESNRRWWKSSSEGSERRKAVSSIDPVTLIKQAGIRSESTLPTVNPSEQSQKLFRASLLNPRLKRNDCIRIDTDFNDETFERHNIVFHREKNSRYREDLREAEEEFAKLIVNLASVFDNDSDPRQNFHVFWKDTDPDLKAFHCRSRPRPIYLNLAHYYRYHYVERVERWRVSMDWYLILAHELAHDVSPQHDDLHETVFAWRCVLHLDALRRCFPFIPPLESML